jgi:hypothetical protein
MPRVSRSALIALLLSGFFVLAGCRRQEPAGASPIASTSPVPATFPVPFHGVIKAGEQRDLMLSNAEITYTIGPGKIRRETVRTDPLSKLVDGKPDAAGIICDVPAGSVVIYRTGTPGKRFVRLPLAEYRKLIAEEDLTAPETSAGQLPSFSVKPHLEGYAGTFFRNTPQPIQTGHFVNRPEVRTVNDLPCDLLTIQMGNVVLEVSHTQRIKVDRPLLELVELSLPAEVTGFPCLLRRLYVIDVHQRALKEPTLSQKAADWAARVAEAVMKEKVELLQITDGVPYDSAFTLDESFTEVPSLDEFLRLFQPAPGRHDWD